MEGKVQRVYERGTRQMSVIEMASIAGKLANKQENEQKVVSTRDRCRFGSNVHNFIVLKHG